MNIADTYGGNRTLAEQCADALMEAGAAKAEAHRLRKKADRIADLCLLKATGKNADERRATARNMQEFVVADDAATEAEARAILAKAAADGLMVQWEDFRTRQATARAEMNLR